MLIFRFTLVFGVSTRTGFNVQRKLGCYCNYFTVCSLVGAPDTQMYVDKHEKKVYSIEKL